MTDRRPNVIYILSDDQRADLLGCMRHPLLCTPHLDQLAVDGTLFTHARCTSPLCTPSRVSHYTGQWERGHAVNFNSGSALAPAAWQDSFPGRLRQAGYWTAWIGKNHVPVGVGGYQSGFLETWFDCWWGNHNHAGFYPKDLPSTAGIYAAASRDTQPEIFAEGALRVIAGESPPGGTAPARPADRPFCLCVTFNAPHGSAADTMQLRPTDDELYRSAYRDRQSLLQAPASFRPWKQSYHKLPLDVYNGVRIPDYDYVKTLHTLQERQLRQCQLVSGIDRFVGRLRQALADTGLADNTLIVYSSDHGLLFGEHGLGGKTLLYEPCLRIPLIIFDPRRPHYGRVRNDALVAVPDVAPTVLELCGLAPSPSMQGRSLAPLLRGEDTPPRRQLFIENLFDWQNYPRCEGVVEERWKYLRYYRRREDPAESSARLRKTLDSYDTCRCPQPRQAVAHEELYDLLSDPDENENLVARPDAADELHRLREDCQAQLAAYFVAEPTTVPR